MSIQENTFLTRKEVAQLFKVSTATVDIYAKKGYIKPLGIGRRVLFRASDIEDALVQL